MARKQVGQLPSGSVRIKVYDYKDSQGKKHYKSFTAPTRKEAQRMADEWKLNRLCAASPMTIMEAVKEYISINESRLSPATYRTYCGYLQYFEVTGIGRIKLQDLTNSDVQLFVNALSKSLSAKSVKNIYQLLKPSVELKRDNFRFKVVLPEQIRVEKHIPSADDIRKVLAACNCPEVKIAVLFALEGMMRRGEACAVTFQDVDLEKRTISINKAFTITIDRDYVIKGTKTRASIRTVAISERLAELIAGLKRKRGYILGYSPQQLSKRFLRTVERAKVAPFTYHALRHFAESTASSLNIPAAYIEAIGGWEHGSEVRTRVYDHVIDGERSKYDQLLLERLQSVISE